MGRRLGAKNRDKHAEIIEQAKNAVVEVDVKEEEIKTKLKSKKRHDPVVEVHAMLEQCRTIIEREVNKLDAKSRSRDGERVFDENDQRMLCSYINTLGGLTKTLKIAPVKSTKVEELSDDDLSALARKALLSLDGDPIDNGFDIQEAVNDARDLGMLDDSYNMDSDDF